MMIEAQKFLISVAPLTRIALSRDQSFFYVWHEPLARGTLVTISIGRRIIEGIVTNCAPDFPRESHFQIKRITKIIERSFLTPQQVTFAEWISQYYYAPLGLVLKHFVPQRIMLRGMSAPIRTTRAHIAYTSDQQALIDQLYSNTDIFSSFFLHAPVVHDKMAVLLGVMQKIYTHTSGQVLYILPELMQTPYISEFFHQFFSADEIAIIHSKIPRGQYYHKWRKIRSGDVRIVIGTRSAIFTPFHDLRAVIVDEAHDPSHKQWDHYPLYDARTASRTLATLHNATHILTSAAPRAVDYADKIAGKKSQTTYVSSATAPTAHIEIVDMKKERWDKNRSPLSRTLVHKIAHTIKKGSHVLLFVNRQGESAFSICSTCRTVITCPTCARALVHHVSKKYLCIHCSFTMPDSAKCMRCKAPIEHIGIGTQRIAKELRKIMPHARTAIVDSSTMKKTGAHKKIYDDFRQGKIDIVIGTQMITKGWHGDHVTLCGIIDMDDLLSLPSYDGNEKAFSHIMQLSARTRRGTVLVQTFQPENPAIQFATRYDFDGFYTEELTLRKILHYPPYAQIIKLTCKDPSKSIVQTLTQEKYLLLIDTCENDPLVYISEPHDPLVNKIRSKYHRQIIVRISHDHIPDALHYILRDCDLHWSIDVDPITIV